MKNAILLHGYPDIKEYYDTQTPSSSNSHWFPWLQKQLMLHDIKADTPEMFKAFDPVYEEWVREIERYDITSDTLIVGHSMGGGFWIRYLSEHPGLKVDKVILVAPWLNVNHEEDINFFDFTLRPSIVAQANEFSVFASDNDGQDVQGSIAFLREKLVGASFTDFHEYGHFTIRTLVDGTFPELLTALLI